MKIGDYIVLGVILLWLVLAFCWMHRQKKRGNCIALDEVQEKFGGMHRQKKRGNCIGCSGCAGKNCKKCEKNDGDGM